jgi:hypothetical protein
MYVKPTAPRPIGGVIDDAIKLYRASFGTCVPIALISSLITGSVSYYVLRTVPALESLRDPAQIWEMLQPSPVWSWFLLPGIASLLLLGGIIASQNALAAGRGSMSVLQALAASFRRLHWLLLAVVLWLAFIGAAIGIALIPISPATRVLGVLGWVVLAIYLWGRLQLWMVALFAEDAGTLRALSISWGLIEGHWWRATMILTVGIIIVAVVSVVFGFVGGLVYIVHPVNPMSLIMGNQVITAIERVFVTPMIPAVLVAMYYDFKLRREGGDLAARTKSLQTS